MKMQIAIAANRSKPIRMCHSYNDDLGCMTGCKQVKPPKGPVGRMTACPFEDGTEYEPNSSVQYQQDCPCWK